MSYGDNYTAKWYNLSRDSILKTSCVITQTILEVTSFVQTVQTEKQTRSNSTHQSSICLNTLKFQSRNFYVQRVTPKYFVGRRVGRVPAEFTVDILPFNSWSWGIVQNIAQNPRIR